VADLFSAATPNNKKIYMQYQNLVSHECILFPGQRPQQRWPTGGKATRETSFMLRNIGWLQ
jgi:hypothetical protein